MRKKNTLYTVNKWNQPLFGFVDREEKNIFDGLTPGQSSLMNFGNQGNGNAGTPSYYVTKLNNGQYGLDFSKVNMSDPISRSIATNYTNSLVNDFSTKSKDFANNTSKLWADAITSPNTEGPNILNTDPNTFFNKDVASSAIQNNNGSSGGGGGGGWQAMAAAGASSIPSGEMNLAGHYYRRGAFDAADPLYYMAGERESAVGNTLSDLGIQAVQSGNPWAALGGAALKITGDFINAAWGIKTDKERKKLVDRSIAQNRNFYSNASSFDDLQSIGPRINTEGMFKGGWFTGGKAAQMNKDIAAANDNAYSFAERSLGNNVYNIGKENMNSLLRKWKAYGGPIETRKENDDMKNNIFYSGGPLFGAPVNNVTGVLDYDLALNKQNIDSMKIQNQSANKMQAPLFMNNSYDLGGDIQMHGGDYRLGQTYEVTEEEANRLKAIGYGFTVVG